jgi:hypothetical protein
LKDGHTIRLLIFAKSRYWRDGTIPYMKALPTQEPCLACHGAAEGIKPEVQSRLQELYPQNKATGYKAGQICGAITMCKPVN